MDTAVLRKKLHNYLEVANDTKIKAIYAIMEEQIEEFEEEYDDVFKAELDRRQASYLSGEAKMITAEESKKRIEAILWKKSS